MVRAATLLAILCLATLLPPAGESPDGRPRRAQEITLMAAQFEWQLIAWADNLSRCQLFIEHPNRPTFTEIAQQCPPEIYQVWASTPVCEAVATGDDLATCQGVYLHFIGPTLSVFTLKCTSRFHRECTG